MRTFVCLSALAAAALGGCSTLTAPAGEPVETRPFATSINIQSVSGSAANPAARSLVGPLTAAVRGRLELAPASGPPANLTFTIAEYAAPRKAPRAKGAPAAARIRVRVSITTPNGAALRQFDVTRSAATVGATGSPTADSLIGQAADAIVATARGEQP